MRNRARRRCTTPAILREAGHEFAASSAPFRNYKGTASYAREDSLGQVFAAWIYIAADVEDSAPDIERRNGAMCVRYITWRTGAKGGEKKKGRLSVE